MDVTFRPRLSREDWSGVPIDLGNIWVLKKQEYTLTCRLVSHPQGWELRMEFGKDRSLLESQTCLVEDDVYAVAGGWRTTAESHGWN